MRKAIKHESGRIPDEVLFSHVREDDLVYCTGEPGDVFLVNPYACLHCGARTRSKSRLILIINFTSLFQGVESAGSLFAAANGQGAGRWPCGNAVSPEPAVNFRATFPMVTLAEIRSPRLRIVPFEERHLTERYVGWLNDPEVVRYSEQRHRRHDLESCREYFEQMRQSGSYFSAIEEMQGQHGHIGNMTVSADAANGLAESRS